MKFKCYRCGWCCRIEKYSSQDEFDLASKALNKLGIKLHGIKMPNGMILWDKPCPALKMENGKAKCLIYDVRPYPCRQFLCGKKSKDDNRPFKSDLVYDLEYLDDLLKIPEFAKIKERIEDEAARWGNAHGWKLEKVSAGGL
jgi:Fe-S-cluster containining protein